MMNLNKKIIQAILDENLVVFAGSGLSKRFNLPDWKGLVYDIIKNLDNNKYNPFIDLINSESINPVDVLNFIRSEKVEIFKYIQNNFEVKSGDFNLHKNILELSGQVITTNYDNAFEMASELSIHPTNYNSNFNISQINRNNKPYILKLHGSYTEPDRCIVFKEQYDELYTKSEHSALQKLKSIFIDKVIVFIGYSFSDQELNMIFSGLDIAFENNIKHFILTTEERCFEGFKFIEPIPIKTHDEINDFIEECLNLKRSNNVSISKQTEVQPINIQIKNIAFLSPDPIDIELPADINNILACFNNLNIKIASGFLNTRTLEMIDDYDLLIICTKTFKSKLYIEEKNLKSNLLTIENIIEYIPNENIPILFITDQNIPNFTNIRAINIGSYKTSLINKFIFKGLRNCDLNFIEENIRSNISSLFDNCIEKGVSQIISIYDISLKDIEIDKKSLDNVIGRVEEQSSIALRLISIISSNKFLNIKASGGIGKTTLIKKVSYELFKRGYFSHGITFKSCEYVNSYEDFEELVIQGFNLDNILDFKEYLEENYSNQKKDSLIILDNFETIVNKLDQLQFNKVIDLLKFVTEFSSIVLTSRETIKLAEDFEDVYTLTQLTTDDAYDLFVKFYGTINEHERKILRLEILEDLLNNNPLAIKLVTKSMIRFSRIEDLRNQLQEHFFEATNEDYSLVYNDDADLNIERTKSLFQSINYSFMTLTSIQKLCFELLSLFPDGISLTNFKKCFVKKTSANNFTDKELRALRDKSLVEDDNGILKLQPIIRRFADFQFLKKSSDERKSYCYDAYGYNSFVLEILDSIAHRASYSEAHKAYSLFRNNLLNVLNYIPDIDNSSETGVEKKYLLNYIIGIDSYIINKKQVYEFGIKINKLKPHFSDLSNAEVLLQALDFRRTYFSEEFDYSYSGLSAIYSIEDMEKRNFKEEEFIETKYKSLISSVHSMEGHTLKALKSRVLNDNVDAYLVSEFFYLGMPHNMKGALKGFYYFESQAFNNSLNVPELEKYINSLYQDQHLEIMQTTYTLSKTKRVDLNTVKKLVVTNPYTKGLKELMLAFLTKNDSEKRQHFESALLHLSHIKYYYLEALFFYCKFLKSIGNDYSDKLQHGLKLSQEFHYEYMNHLFSNLDIQSSQDYIVDYSRYPIESLEKYIVKHTSYWEKALKDEYTYFM